MFEKKIERPPAEKGRSRPVFELYSFRGHRPSRPKISEKIYIDAFLGRKRTVQTNVRRKDNSFFIQYIHTMRMRAFFFHSKKLSEHLALFYTYPRRVFACFWSKVRSNRALLQGLVWVGDWPPPRGLTGNSLEKVEYFVATCPCPDPKDAHRVYGPWFVVLHANQCV